MLLLLYYINTIVNCIKFTEERKSKKAKYDVEVYEDDDDTEDIEAVKGKKIILYLLHIVIESA